jgi:hypothetical protein
LSGTAITTTPTAFQLNNNALTLVGGGVIPLSAGVTGLYAGTGQVLHIRATGQYSGSSGATTLTLQPYEIPASVIAAGLTPTSFTGWNAAGPGTGAKVLSTAAGSFNLDLRVQLDAAGNLEGSFKAVLNGATIVSEVTITPITGLVGEADLNFAIVATLGVAETGVILILSEFALDLE